MSSANGRGMRWKPEGSFHPPSSTFSSYHQVRINQLAESAKLKVAQGLVPEEAWRKRRERRSVSLRLEPRRFVLS
jgi:hypothetical protein